MKNYQLIQELIGHLESFERDQPNSDQQTLFNFVAWLNQHLLTSAAEHAQHSDYTRDAYQTPDVYIGIMIGFLNRYSKLYAKKGLENTPLVTLDDFTYLATLWQHQPLTKIALIERNIHEKTTGTEIIRRLLANGLVEQYADETDKRSKRLQLTPRGQELLMGMWPLMGQIAILMGGNLTTTEKMVLVGLLQKLHSFHNPIFLNNRDGSITELIKNNIY
ncbi:transcriptional regulator, MarR family [Fibrisoma limi BUZ 3]|uniref:Transcriptional regulator, MarR family n=1 Tax=Fibrisoma limi BUZ 3 TaxID=1185876 RepID=I2GC19_9BACT|nr:MarR family transcriptional regulator [Fibrisoma limi]CCH51443.1 transcriptional regulator, MarR family [Fibrisoma limi BUZ 3]